MTGIKKYPGQPVFGLDIGTRSVVGTVGYRSGDSFYVLAEEIREHDTRAMLDGQIHDIEKVGMTIADVRAALEFKLGLKLSDVCIAAAGRVLVTKNVHVETAFDKDTMITKEEVFELTSKGIEKAYGLFTEETNVQEKYYCVGYSIIHFYLNGNMILNPENHKTTKLEADLIATFLPNDVIDGLYRAVEIAELNVVNLTLEPIAAIEVAIPEKFRMLNIALVDVGAGTSDICITKEGSIAAYGMIPCAGDSLTETISQQCLTEFVMAEQIKKGISEQETVNYEDIMCLPQKISRSDVLKMLEPDIDGMTQKVADEITRLNGNKPVSAVFVVGGGGKIAGYTEHLANKLGIDVTRVALRGEEVMQKIIFPDEIKKDSILVTPIGICLNYYEQNNNFVFVSFNGERYKLYDTTHLAVVDAAMQANYPTESLFPKRGKELTYFVNKSKRIARGDIGEAAQITVNGDKADINTAIHANDVIRITEATAGDSAHILIEQLPEYRDRLSIVVNDKKVEMPVFAEVNGCLQPGSYEISDKDNIEFLGYITVSQMITFLDIDENIDNIMVNNSPADSNTKIYERFSVTFDKGSSSMLDNTVEEDDEKEEFDSLGEEDEDDTEEAEKNNKPKRTVIKEPEVSISVIANNSPIVLQGKSDYVFVDVFDAISFDLTKSEGRAIITKLNGRTAQYMEPLHQGDVIEIYWAE